ncbi:MAG: hypothetical protein HC906_17295 [Bacteroidales bacterium]|nr:hypothetical protein [Bacteroidales bacterium]
MSHFDIWYNGFKPDKQTFSEAEMECLYEPQTIRTQDAPSLPLYLWNS